MKLIGVCMGENENMKFRQCPNFKSGGDFECKYVMKMWAMGEQEYARLKTIEKQIHAEMPKPKRNIGKIIWSKVYQFLDIGK